MKNFTALLKSSCEWLLLWYKLFMEDNKHCISCQKTKALIECECCHVDVCKYCAHILPEESFSFFAQKPAELSHRIYCHTCYLNHVEDSLEKYNLLMDQARNVQVYLSNQGKETRLVKRLEKPFKIENCADHNETMLRLAFFAAEKGFNTLVDVNITSKKIREGAYQKLIWSGTAVPVQMNSRHVVKDRSTWQNPN